MNFQYYETLLNNNKENLLFYVQNISPPIKQKELPVIIGEIMGKKKNIGLKEVIDGYVEVKNAENEKEADFSGLLKDEMVALFKTLISKEDNSVKAIKWRFFQYIKYERNIRVQTTYINIEEEKKNAADFILETQDDKAIFIVCEEVLDLDLFKENIKKIKDFSQKNDIIPDRIIFAVHRTHRDIPLDIHVNVNNMEIYPELWIEWVEPEKMFNGDDLIIIQNNFDEMVEVAGFNFSRTADLLDYAYEFTIGGQISIFKQVGYYSEQLEKDEEVELIWKGIMIKGG